MIGQSSGDWHCADPSSPWLSSLGPLSLLPSSLLPSSLLPSSLLPSSLLPSSLLPSSLLPSSLWPSSLWPSSPWSLSSHAAPSAVGTEMPRAKIRSLRNMDGVSPPRVRFIRGAHRRGGPPTVAI